ncbi:phosphoglycerate kinase [Candidatus Borrarchaeum sp.]|uniref:phosphoglycerate kinase n=1 Tax=Candidatus Borrarchaeum sp. TaxID=2846742 RepID=UPI00257A18EA|nr:phosphoglycerate kinase [Candidatus Borrarchaeum sp.]
MEVIKSIDDIEVKGKRVLVRVDFNSPIDPMTGKIQDDTRIRRHAKTIQNLVERGAKVIVMAHQGRPGDADFTSLEQHAEVLGKVLGRPVQFVNSIFDEAARDKISELNDGDILVLENTRFYSEEVIERPVEEQAKTEMVQKLAPLLDAYVNDAFSAAHRSQPSLVGFIPVLPSAIGYVMKDELDALMKVAGSSAQKPCVYVLGGAKPEDTLKVIEYVLEQNIADSVLASGIMGNLFLLAKGFDIGDSYRDFLSEKGYLKVMEKAKDVLNRFESRIVLPEDLAIGENGTRVEVSLNELPLSALPCDIGKKTIEKFSQVINNAKTIVCNGSPGQYEKETFAVGTKEVFSAIAESTNKGAFSVAGGGHTIAGLNKYNLLNKISFVSTSGKAMLLLLMGEYKKLVVLEAFKAYGQS